MACWATRCSPHRPSATPCASASVTPCCSAPISTCAWSVKASWPGCWPAATAKTRPCARSTPSCAWARCGSSAPTCSGSRCPCPPWSWTTPNRLEPRPITAAYSSAPRASPVAAAGSASPPPGSTGRCPWPTRSPTAKCSNSAAGRTPNSPPAAPGWSGCATSWPSASPPRPGSTNSPAP